MDLHFAKEAFQYLVMFLAGCGAVVVVWVGLSVLSYIKLKRKLTSLNTMLRERSGTIVALEELLLGSPLTSHSTGIEKEDGKRG